MNAENRIKPNDLEGFTVELSTFGGRIFASAYRTQGEPLHGSGDTLDGAVSAALSTKESA